jgi:hypothetical protein
MTNRYSITPVHKPRVDAFLEWMAGRAETMTAAEAEAFFDREWRRRRRSETGTDDQLQDGDRADILIGLAVQRSMARVDKETGFR